MKKIGSLFLIFATIVSLVSCTKNSKLPEITEQEFPFYIEYSVHGEKTVINDTIICKFVGLIPNIGYKLPATIREWSEKLKSTNSFYTDLLIIEDYQKKSIFKDRINSCSFVYLSFGRAEYYMGESEYSQTAIPCFYYHESFKNQNGTQSGYDTILSKEQLRDFFDIEIIQFSFESPIVNTYYEQQ